MYFIFIFYRGSWFSMPAL